MRKITRTVYGSHLQTALLLNLPYEPPANAILNTKFDIQADVGPADPDLKPSLKYMTIGNGGHGIATGAQGIPYTQPLIHRARDAALFNHLPFVLRTTDNDLDSVKRQKYGLRRMETHGGVNYFAYYLRRINYSSDDVAVELHYTSVENGAEETAPFVPTTQDLSPTAPDVDSTGVISTTGDYLSASAIIPIDFTADDVEELINVAKVLYDNPELAVISEIGLCSGVDRRVTGQAQGGASFNYLEAVQVQIAMFITAYYPVGYTNQGFEFKLQAGKTEPLYGEDDED